MDRGELLLQGLLIKLRGWFPAIQRTTRAEKVEVEPGEYGAFSIVVRWRDPGGEERHWSRLFDRPYCFGVTYALAPDAWAVERKVCDHARDIMRAVLQRRGAVD